MSKPSFTQSEQVKHLSTLWNLSYEDTLQMLKQIRSMDVQALVRGERLYWDDFGTMNVEIKAPTWKTLPGADDPLFIPARVNVKFEESQDLLLSLNEVNKERLEQENTVFLEQPIDEQ